LPTDKLSSSPADRSLRGVPRSLRIIVADDERDTVLTLTMILRDEGHDVQAAYNGSRVLPLVREFDPDVVMLDIALPEKSGYDHYLVKPFDPAALLALLAPLSLPDSGR
jgi:DNA-binding response OmpR family regulator